MKHVLYKFFNLLILQTETSPNSDRNLEKKGLNTVFPGHIFFFRCGMTYIWQHILEISFPCIHLVLQVFDIDELIKPRKEAAKKKMMDELRDETTESAISKITAAVQTQQLEAAEDEDECKPGALQGRGGGGTPL